MKLIVAIIQPSKLEAVKEELNKNEIYRLTVTDVQGYGQQKGKTTVYRGHEYKVNLLPKVRLEIAVNEACAYIDFTNNLNDIREGLIAVQDEVKIVKLTRSQRNELFKRIRVGFSQFDEKRNSFIKSRKKQKESETEEIQSNTKEETTKSDEVSNSVRIQKEIEETQAKIENIDNELNKLDEK